ncbi:MAG: DUF433 domain-containing protein [Planctomyces sp.]|nr:DUF433 domain-containing protein [Planctomyces sp.]
MPLRFVKRKFTSKEIVLNYGMVGQSFFGEESMDLRDRVVLNPDVLTGKPVIRGTRLAVEFIVDLLGQGWSETQVLENYPGITHEDILACLQYASHQLKSERVYPVTA